MLSKSGKLSKKEHLFEEKGVQSRKNGLLEIRVETRNDICDALRAERAKVTKSKSANPSIL